MKQFVMCFLIVLILSACTAENPTFAPVQNTKPSMATSIPASSTSVMTGEQLLTDRCADCHSPDKVKQSPQNRDGWVKTVSRMMSKGAQLTDTEKQILVDYLAATYGK